jgi:mxaA protein
MKKPTSVILEGRSLKAHAIHASAIVISGLRMTVAAAVLFAHPVLSVQPAIIPVVEQPRSTGYFVGDLVTQRILLDRDGRFLRPVALPRAGRVSTWFERRRTTIETDSALRHWLVAEYQILNAPPKLTTVTLPAWVLRTGIDSALKIPPASINIAPLSLPGSPAQVGTADLRPDRLPPVIPTAPLRRAIAFSGGALVLTLSGWLAWLIWRNRRAAARQPFAHAWREMRALDDREPRMWQTLHRAFDRAAGRVIHPATVPALFERAPELIPVRAQIEQFYAQSTLLFFSAPSLADGASPIAGSTTINASLPRALCLELRRIERRHEQ